MVRGNFNASLMNSDNDKVVAINYPGGSSNTWTYNATLNASSKTFTVPANGMYMLDYVHGEITNTATVGNRVLWITITDGVNTLWVSAKTASITASQVGVIEIASMAVYSTTAAQVVTLAGAAPNVALRYPLPGNGLLLNAGSVIRVYDVTAVDAAADDLTVVLHFTVY